MGATEPLRAGCALGEAGEDIRHCQVGFLKEPGHRHACCFNPRCLRKTLRTTATFAAQLFQQNSHNVSMTAPSSRLITLSAYSSGDRNLDNPQSKQILQ